MAEAAPASVPSARPPEPDERVLFHDVSWDQFEAILAIRGDAPIAVYALRGERYERVGRSEVLPDLDLALVASFARAPSESQAVRAFRAALRSR